MATRLPANEIRAEAVWCAVRECWVVNSRRGSARNSEWLGVLGLFGSDNDGYERACKCAAGFNRTMAWVNEAEKKRSKKKEGQCNPSTKKAA